MVNMSRLGLPSSRLLFPINIPYIAIAWPHVVAAKEEAGKSVTGISPFSYGNSRSRRVSVKLRLRMYLVVQSF
jgi:hypothetical protein